MVRVRRHPRHETIAMKGVMTLHTVDDEIRSARRRSAPVVVVVERWMVQCTKATTDGASESIVGSTKEAIYLAYRFVPMDLNKWRTGCWRLLLRLARGGLRQHQSAAAAFHCHSHRAAGLLQHRRLP